jgi:hypothetical protein
MKYTPSPFSDLTSQQHGRGLRARGTPEGAEPSSSWRRNMKRMFKTEPRRSGARKVPRPVRGDRLLAHLRYTFKTLKDLGVNVTAPFTAAFSFLYDNVDELMALTPTCPTPTALSASWSCACARPSRISRRRGVPHEQSCKHWSGALYEMERQLREAAGIPTVVFDGDKSDPRAFSEAQYLTRIQASSKSWRKTSAVGGSRP